MISLTIYKYYTYQCYTKPIFDINKKLIMSNLIINCSQATPGTLEHIQKHYTEDSTIAIVACGFNGSRSTIEYKKSKGKDVELMENLVEMSNVYLENYFPNVNFCSIAERNDLKPWIKQFFPNLFIGNSAAYETEKFVKFAQVLELIQHDSRFSYSKTVFEAVFAGIDEVLNLDITFGDLVTNAMMDFKTLANIESEDYKVKFNNVYTNVTSRIETSVRNEVTLTELLEVITKQLDMCSNDININNANYVSHSNHGHDGSVANRMKNEMLANQDVLSHVEGLDINRIVQILFNYIVAFYVPRTCLLDNQAMFKFVSLMCINLTDNKDVYDGIEENGLCDVTEYIDILQNETNQYDPAVIFDEFEKIVVVSDGEGDDVVATVALANLAIMTGNCHQVKIICQVANESLIEPFEELYGKLVNYVDNINNNIVDVVYNGDLVNYDKQVNAIGLF